ncbi:hypothetical protein FPZ12_037275 [Amycolatopsis acidicola]|uniref:DUF3137 domain-containing protein n=1 Tax=Amycolatopsis acidicola TaxID=2596893 RepID=A0A5N0UQB8_9PSEU|nr:hypothetical protein [Amycolatopsis acidicola]KAA9152228.1 hypothetical protein FPZ12_037275 [Amycolatopsis acidicola]
MSPVAVIAIAVAGTILLGAGLVWLYVLVDRRFRKEENVILGRMREALPRLGWEFTKRDDSVARLWSRQVEDSFHRNPFQPLVGPPRSGRADNVITGVHRGRPFVAAKLDTHYDADNFWLHWIGVRTPAVRPSLSVVRSATVVSAINNALWGEIRIGHPEFDERFDVKSDNAAFAAAFLSPALTEFLLRDPRPFRGFILRGDHLDALDRIGDHRDPEELIPALDLRCDILDRVPAAAWA